MSASEVMEKVRWGSRLRRLPALLLSPLPVELVAGGEGNPEREASGEPSGLSGGSGRRGRSGGVELEIEPRDPM